MSRFYDTILFENQLELEQLGPNKFCKKGAHYILN